MIDAIAELASEFERVHGYKAEFLIVGGKYIEELRTALLSSTDPKFKLINDTRAKLTHGHMSNWTVLGLKIAVTNQDDSILKCA